MKVMEHYHPLKLLYVIWILRSSIGNILSDLSLQILVLFSVYFISTSRGHWEMAIASQTPDILGERQSGQDVRTQNGKS